MFGLEAISTHNGWAISFLGVTIVFSGLTVLSLTISQLHKALDAWDNRAAAIKWVKKHLLSANSQTPPILTKYSGDNQDESLRQYKLLVDVIGEPFPLPKLLELAKDRGLIRPFSTINDMILQGIIVPDGKGYYTWKTPPRLKKKK